MREPSAPKTPSFASLVQLFFTEYLVAQRAVSPRTVACYRDGLMLFLAFAQRRLGKTPTTLQLVDIDPDLILSFLDDLEHKRHNSVRSRNLRLTALRAFLKFAARRDVLSLHVIERALSVPMKRFERPMLNFLSREEMLAVLGQPGQSWTSQRDHLLLAMLYNTGARVSEIIGVRVADVVLDGAACVHLHGKGRKQRAVPLWKSTVRETRRWLRSNASLRGEATLLPNRNRQPMTRSNVEQRLDLAVARATTQQRSLAKKRISPHTIRHTTAMHLLQSGVAFNVIALWLGHESPNTTHRYVEADLAMKEKALARLEQPTTHLRRYRPTDALMTFLQQL
jgi:site-specific recombinase XerD